MVRFIAVLAACLLLAGCQRSGPESTLLQDPNPTKRAAAATKLGGVSAASKGAKDAVAALALATCDSNPDVRDAAIKSLAKIGGADARQALLDVLRGRQYTRAALVRYKAVADRHPDVPEVLSGMAKAQADLGLYADAEKNWDALLRNVSSLDPQQAGRYMGDIRGGYENLRMAYERANDKDGVARVSKQIDAVAEKMKAMPPGGGMGGMGGMFGGPGGLPEGIQLQP